MLPSTMAFKESLRNAVEAAHAAPVIVGWTAIGLMLNPLRAEEDELLSYAWGRRTNSRLSCQIRLNEDLDGLSVEVPENQG